MTKTFWYDEKHPYTLEDDFYYYFEQHPEIDFYSWLRWSFEFSVMNGRINTIQCVVHDGKGEFSIWMDNCFEYPAGEEDVTCSSELLNGFYKRLMNPEEYISGEGVWNN